MTLKLYGIASCDTCRKAGKWLAAQGHDFEFHDLRRDGLDLRLLEEWAVRIGWKEILNTRSLTWRKMPEVDRADMNRSKALAAMVEHPTLVKRPVLACADFIAVGFTPAQYHEIFTRNRP